MSEELRAAARALHEWLGPSHIVGKGDDDPRVEVCHDPEHPIHVAMAEVALAASGAVTLDVERLARAEHTVDCTEEPKHRGVSATTADRRRAAEMAAEYTRFSGDTDRPDRLREAVERIVRLGPSGHEFQPWRNDYPSFDPVGFNKVVQRGELHPTCSMCSASNNALTTDRLHQEWEAYQACRAALSEVET